MSLSEPWSFVVARARNKGAGAVHETHPDERFVNFEFVNRIFELGFTPRKLHGEIVGVLRLEKGRFVWTAST